MTDPLQQFSLEGVAGSASPMRPWIAVGALALAVGLVAIVSLHTVGAIKDAVVHAVLAGTPVSAGIIGSALRWTDGALFGCASLAVALLAWLEWRQRAFSTLLDGSPRAPFLLALAILLAWLGHSYWFPGLLLAGDTGSHIARFLEVRRALEQGALPQWTNYAYMGSPLLGFTGPLTYVVGGATDVLVRDPVVTAKLLLFVLHMAAGGLCYTLLRRWKIGRFGAAVGALAYAGSFAHLHLFLYRGVIPQAFTICFLLLAFLTAEGLMRTRPLPWRDWAGFAFATAGLILNHQPHALFVAAYLAVFGLASLALGRWRLDNAIGLVSAGLVGAAMGAVAVLPVLNEADWVMIVPESAMFTLRAPSLTRLLNLVVWRDTLTGVGVDYWAYLGLVTVGLAVVGLAAAVRQRMPSERLRLVAAIIPCLALSFFLANPVVRDVMFLLLFTIVPAAVGAEVLASRFAHVPRLPVAIMAVLLLDLSSTSVLPVARTDKDYFIAAGRYLERVAPNQRVVEMGNNSAGRFTADIGPSATPLSYYTSPQRVAGHHNMAATHVHNFAESAVKRAEHDLLERGGLSEPTATLLALLNVARIICMSPTAIGCPASFGVLPTEGPLGRVVPVRDATPVLFSRRLLPVALPGDLDKPMFWPWDFDGKEPRVAHVAEYIDTYLATAQVDLAARQAERLPVIWSAPPPPPAVPGVDNAPWHPRLVDYAVSQQTVTIVVEADRPGYVQLAHPWFPASIVRLNGATAVPLEGALHLIVLPIQPGVSRIEIAPGITPIRREAAGISLAGLAIALAVPGFGRRRRRRGVGVATLRAPP